jgi:hypothetical protein
MRQVQRESEREEGFNSGDYNGQFGKGCISLGHIFSYLSGSFPRKQGVLRAASALTARPLRKFNRRQAAQEPAPGNYPYSHALGATTCAAPSACACACGALFDRLLYEDNGMSSARDAVTTCPALPFFNFSFAGRESEEKENRGEGLKSRRYARRREKRNWQEARNGKNF